MTSNEKDTWCGVWVWRDFGIVWVWGFCYGNSVGFTQVFLWVWDGYED